MVRAKLPELLERWKEQYQLLLAYSEELLKNFDIYGGEEANTLIVRRQTIIDEFQKIDLRLAECLGERETPGDRRLLEEFRIFQEGATRKVLALDALVIALAKERLACLKGELNTLSRKKTALSAYQNGGRK